MPEEQGKVDILEVSFDNVTREEAVQRVISLLAQPERKGYVVTPNSEIVYMCRKQPGLLEALNDAYLVLPDGIGVIYAGKILKRPLKGKVAGIDFASRLMEEMARRGDSLFLLGAKPGVAALAGERLQQKYPGLHICGVHDGYFKEDGSVIREVNESGAKVLFVCLGAPKQEHWMQDHTESAQCTAYGWPWWISGCIFRAGKTCPGCLGKIGLRVAIPPDSGAGNGSAACVSCRCSSLRLLARECGENRRKYGREIDRSRRNRRFGQINAATIIVPTFAAGRKAISSVGFSAIQRTVLYFGANVFKW